MTLLPLTPAQIAAAYRSGKTFDEISAMIGCSHYYLRSRLDEVMSDAERKRICSKHRRRGRKKNGGTRGSSAEFRKPVAVMEAPPSYSTVTTAQEIAQERNRVFLARLEREGRDVA